MTASPHSQADVVDFLRSPRAWASTPDRIDVIETHGAIIFMAGDDVLKIKRAVKLPYLDFSTLASRRTFLDRELALNAPAAPGLYRGVVAITREADGRLAISGNGEPVEWALAMRRFDQSALLSKVVDAGTLARTLSEDLADTIRRYHDAAPVAPASAERMDGTVEGVIANLKRHEDAALGDAVEAFARGARRNLDKTAELRMRRAASGCVRRCHGDLHLGNIVIWQGKPVPFDALEFDETLATIDVLYDLAFLLMDLDRRGSRDAANIVLNRYLWRDATLQDIEGLAVLPLFLATRAAIRAMVALDRADANADMENRPQLFAHARDTLRLAVHDLDPPPARLTAIGGLSGTGKTTLAARLAPSIGPAPGALHLRSDLERKRLAGLEPEVRLPPDAYTATSSAQVYATLIARAKAALGAGHSVILDAVYANEHERRDVEALAKRMGVAFSGIWLEGSGDVLKARIAARRNDASDATPAVVEKQLGYDLGAMTWTRIAAEGCTQDTVGAAREVLRL